MDKLELSPQQIEGFVSLLQDSDERSLQIMSEQLCKFSHTCLQSIDAQASRFKGSDFIDNWHQVNRLSINLQIKKWKQLPDPDLEEGLFLISRMKNPILNKDKYVSVLDSYAERAARNLSIKSSEDELIQSINHVLFYEENYIGNQVAYYDLNNNFLHTVINTRTGNPIMLSCIYILVGRRLGLDIKGIGTPGHFVVSFNGTLLDPFFGGKTITRDECVIRAQELNVHWRNEYLEPIDDVQIVLRCLRNLIAIYKKQNDLDIAEDLSSILA
jgi:regulator of sirC expression with transglutaminase-like and TPR domain